MCNTAWHVQVPIAREQPYMPYDTTKCGWPRQAVHLQHSPAALHDTRLLPSMMTHRHYNKCNTCQTLSSSHKLLWLVICASIACISLDSPVLSIVVCRCTFHLC
jgi:hypothetical protein